MICKNNCNISRDFLGRPIVAGGYGGGGGGYCAPFLWVQGKALVGTMWQSSQKLQGFSTEITYF